MNPEQKGCRRCSRLLDLSEFRRDKRSPDGRGVTCKECIALGKRANQLPVSLDFVMILADRLSPQDRRQLWEWITPVDLWQATKQPRPQPDYFTKNFR